MLDLHEIDQFLLRVTNASSSDEVKREFEKYSIEYDLSIPADPFSLAYREKQLLIYQKLAGKPYSHTNEKSAFDVESAVFRPYPYSTESCQVVGDHMMAIGFFIKNLQLNAGARLVEFGPGWGNLTITLAKMGFQVTAVDIENNFLRLIERRALLENLDIGLVHSDFSYISKIDEPYDAIIFFECFHHAADHLFLMEHFDKAVRKNGIVCFVSEPINPEFPIPWGLRMDGHSLWAIRNNGWLELGFNDKYFALALERYGWRGLSIKGIDGPNSHMIIAKRKEDWNRIFTYKDYELKQQIGTIEKNGCISDGTEGYLAYGPYISLPPGSYRAELLLNNTVTFSGELVMDVTVDNGTNVLAEMLVRSDIANGNNPFIVFSSDCQMQNLEIRVRLMQGTFMYLEGISLQAV